MSYKVGLGINQSNTLGAMSIKKVNYNIFQ
jgi:hypothetical protein